MFFVFFFSIAVQGGNLFYVFANDGVYVINPETSTTVNHIRADDVINGTTKPVCTRSQQKACNWGGAVSVNLMYVYVADFLGQRVLVLDIAAQKFVEEVPTDYYPYQLKYLRWEYLNHSYMFFLAHKTDKGNWIDFIPTNCLARAFSLMHGGTSLL